jgi:hypothetical protein
LTLPALLTASPAHLDALRILALAGPRGAWIGAGFVRNLVWDAQAGRAADVAALADLDVVMFDPSLPPACDADFEAALRGARKLPWSVTNQAHIGHCRDLRDALAQWPETATAIAVRLREGRIEILAPHGLQDLHAGIIRPTPAHRADPSTVRARVSGKGWLARWPHLTCAWS